LSKLKQFTVITLYSNVTICLQHKEESRWLDICTQLNRFNTSYSIIHIVPDCMKKQAHEYSI